MWTGENEWANPALVLDKAKDRRDIVEGLVPEGGVTWLYGASMSFKTFVAMSLAQAASAGVPWLGRETEECAVVYVGAEGGLSLHARRAGAEMASGSLGPLYVVSERPALDTRLGQLRLRGILQGLLGGALFDAVYSDPEEDLAYEGAASTYWQEDGAAGVMAILVVIDTYSQTSGGDDKANVSAYIKGLRDMIDKVQAGGVYRMAVIVIDHATKAGGSYMGSVAKLNDVDSQIEVVRAKNLATLYHRKVKDGVEIEPLVVELESVELPYEDAYGRPLTTLAVKDGTKAARLAEIAEGKAGVLLRIVEDEGGVCGEDLARRLFVADPANAGIKGESVARAFKRCKDTLLRSEAVEMVGDNLVVT